MSLRRIKLSWQSQYLTGQGRRLVMTASDAYLMANEIFKHYQHATNPVSPAAGTTNDFVSICTPEELTTLPSGAPDTDSNGYFRLAVADSIFTTATVADIAQEDIEADVRSLKDALDAADSLSIAESIWIGEPPA